MASRLVAVCWVSVCWLGGCTGVIHPTFSEAEFLTNEPKAAGTVRLVVSEEFRTYTRKQVDSMDLKQWQFEVGPAAVDSLRYELQSQFERVDVRLGPATWLSDPQALPVQAVLVPEFVDLKSEQPLVFKFEDYKVSMQIRVTVYDPAGLQVYQRTYAGFGKKQGAIGYESAGHAAHPVACRTALRNIAGRVVQDLRTYLEKKRLPGDAPSVSYGP